MVRLLSKMTQLTLAFALWALAVGCISPASAADVSTEPVDEPGVATKVERAIVRGAHAAASGVERGVKAAASGVERGARAAGRAADRGVAAAASGVARGARATGDAADSIARKAGASSSAASSPVAEN